MFPSAANSSLCPTLAFGKTTVTLFFFLFFPDRELQSAAVTAGQCVQVNTHTCISSAPMKPVIECLPHWTDSNTNTTSHSRARNRRSAPQLCLAPCHPWVQASLPGILPELCPSTVERGTIQLTDWLAGDEETRIISIYIYFPQMCPMLRNR